MGIEGYFDIVTKCFPECISKIKFSHSPEKKFEHHLEYRQTYFDVNNILYSSARERRGGVLFKKKNTFKKIKSIFFKEIFFTFNLSN